MSDAFIGEGEYITTVEYQARLATLPVLSVDQGAALLGMPTSSFEALLAKMRAPDFTGPKLRTFRVGRRRLIRTVALLDYCAEREEVEASSPS